MNCAEVREKLPEMLSGPLPDEERKRLEAHLAGCADCRRERESLERVCHLLRSAPAPAVRVDVPAIHREAPRRERRRARRWRRTAVVLCGAAAAALLLTAVLNLEVRIEGHQVVVCWGTPLPDQASAGPSKVAQVPRPAPTIPPSVAERLRVLDELVQALAVDVESRDLRQRQALARLRSELSRSRQEALTQWVMTRQDVEALYAHRFPEDKGDTP